MEEVTKPASIDYCKQMVIDTIIDGRELSPGQLQLIVAVLRGKTSRLGALYGGHTTEFEMDEAVLGYKPVLKAGRPARSQNKYVKIALATYFRHLRTVEKKSADDAYQSVAYASININNGKSLGLETVKKYISDGNNYITQEEERVRSLCSMFKNVPWLTILDTTTQDVKVLDPSE